MESTESSSMEWQATDSGRNQLEPKELSEADRELLKTLRPKSVFVTGANRGLGLEFVKQLVKLSNPPSVVFATYRDSKSTEELKKIQASSNATTKVELIEMDVTKIKDVKKAKDLVEGQVKEKGLNLLINNAGVAEILYFPQLSEKNMKFHFDVNAIGPVLVMQEFLPLLKLAAGSTLDKLSASRSAVLNICAWGASITRTMGESTGELSVGSCKMSKAALNVAMRIVAHQVRKDGILVVMMCPGWSKTDMGTEQAISSPEQSIERILVTLAKLGDDHQGKFMDKCGEEYEF